MNLLLVVLLILGLGTSVVFLGGVGMILVYALPGYIVVGVAGVAAVMAIRRGEMRAGSGVLLSALALAAYVVGRALVSPNAHQAELDFYMMIAALVVYLLTAQFLTNPKRRGAVVGALLALVLVQAAIGAIQFRNGDNFMPIPGLNRPDYGWRASGFYGCPNHLSGLIEITILLGWSMVFWSRWPVWGKLVTAWICLVGMGTQLLTGSRGGYLSLTAGLVVFVLLSLVTLRKVSPRRFWPALAAVLLAGAVMYGGVRVLVRENPSVGGRLHTVMDTSNMRVKLWEGAWEQFKLSPFFGTGSGTYLFYGRKFRPPEIENDPIFVHNDYLHLLAEYGAVGAFLLLIFLAAHLTRATGALRWIASERMAAANRKQSTALALTIGAISAVAALLVHSVVDFNIHVPANALVMAFVFGLLANAGLQTMKGALGVKSFALASRCLVPVLGLFLLATCVPLLRPRYLCERSRMAYTKDQHIQAIDFAQRALILDPDNPEPYYYLGWSQYEISLEQEIHYARKIIAARAAKTLTQGVNLMPQDTRLLVAAAHTLRRSGQYEEAEKMYLRALEWGPNSANIHARYGLMLVEVDRIDEAKHQLEQSVKLLENELARQGLKELETAAQKQKAGPENEDTLSPIMESPLDVSRGF